MGSPLPPLEYTVPVGLPSGKATIAWTWFNRVGNREIYMRCHKATVEGEGTDMSGFTQLPDMFVANIPALTTCKTVEGLNMRFPNPGQDKLGEGDGDPVGDCAGAAAGPAVRFSKRHIERNAL